MTKKKKILIVGSSMALPRLEVSYEETWIYKLICSLPDCIIIDKSRRGSTSERLLKEGAGFKDTRRGADLLEYYNPDVVITQIGVTDCAPRYLKRYKMSTKILNKMPSFIKKRVYQIIKKYSERNVKNADVPLEKFATYFRNYTERAAEINTKIICVLIAPATSLLKEKSLNMASAIELYNSELIKIAEEFPNFIVISPYTIDEIDSVAIDEFHVNEQGHQILFEKLKIILRENIIVNKCEI